MLTYEFGPIKVDICDECDEVCSGTDDDRLRCLSKNPNWINDRENRCQDR